MPNERSSNFELLRLLCIFGILVMHTFANIDTTASILNTTVNVFVNSLFNTGVTCFILISGYFGIRFDLKKLIRLDLMVIFFSVLSTILLGDISIKTLVKSCIPVLSRQYWFITCYFALCVLAPFLNQIPEKLSRETFRRLILVLILIFSLIPTITTYDIMQDAGKGLVDFIMIYLIGRYLALYHNKPHRSRSLLCGILLSVLAVFILDTALTAWHGVIYTTFSRDCSVFIIFASVLLLLLFREMQFKSRIINRAAANVLAIYVSEHAVQACLSRYLDMNLYAGKWYLIFLVFAYTALIMLLILLVNELRKCTIGRLEPWISNILADICRKTGILLIRWMDKLLTFFIRR